MKRSTKPFLVVCTPDQLAEQVRLCKNSEYEVIEQRDINTINIRDGRKPVLSACTCSGVCFVKLHPRYYRHPFD